MKRMVWSILLSALLMMGLTVPALADLSPGVASRAVVVSTCLTMDGNVYNLGWGTGFFVSADPIAAETLPEDEEAEVEYGTQYLVTSYQAIADYITYGQGDSVGLSVNGTAADGYSNVLVYYSWNDYEKATLVASDQQKDLALLKLEAPTDKRTPFPLCSPTDDMAGSPVYAVGFPALEGSVSGTPWNASSAGGVSGTFTGLTLGEDGAYIQTNCPILPTNSGGPLVSEDGLALGVLTGTSGSAVSIDDVIPLLQQNNVSFTLTDGTAEPEAEGLVLTGAAALLVPIAIAVVVLAVILAAAAFLLTRKPKKTVV